VDGFPADLSDCPHLSISFDAAQVKIKSWGVG
jgi:hypothetical protein